MGPQISIDSQEYSISNASYEQSIQESISPNLSSLPAISPATVPQQPSTDETDETNWKISSTNVNYTVEYDDSDQPDKDHTTPPPQPTPTQQKYSSALRGAHELLKQSRSRRNHRTTKPVSIEIPPIVPNKPSFSSSSSSEEDLDNTSPNSNNSTKSRRALILQMAKARIQKEKETSKHIEQENIENIDLDLINNLDLD